jgi:HEAT repeat protein
MAILGVLNRVWPVPTAAVPVLTEILKDKAKDVKLRTCAAFSLAELGQRTRADVPALKQALLEAVPALKQALLEEESELRLGAAVALVVVSNDSGDDILGVLGKALNHENERIRLIAAGALSKLDLAGSGALPVLIAILRDPRNGKDMRVNAAVNLGKIGRGSKAAVSALVEALRDRDPYVVTYSSVALSEIGPEAIPALAEAFKDGDALVRRAAVSALADMKGDIAEASSALKEAAGDQDGGTRMYAALALQRIRISALVSDLQNKTGQPLRDAIRGLAEIGRDAAAAVPSLLPLLEDKDSTVRRLAALALGKMGASAAAAIPALTAAKEDPDQEVRDQVEKSLKAIGTPKSQPARGSDPTSRP